jgi:hypothetical protein
MIKAIQGKLPLHILICLSAFSLFFSGCSQKEPQVIIQKEYIYEKPFEFVIYDTKGLRVNAKTKELQRICTPLVLEVGGIYRKFINGYEEQIKEYNTYNKNKSINNTKDTYISNKKELK